MHKSLQKKWRNQKLESQKNLIIRKVMVVWDQIKLLTLMMYQDKIYIQVYLFQREDHTQEVNLIKKKLNNTIDY